MIDAAILFCSKIACITFVVSSHLFNVIRLLEKRTNPGKVFADLSKNLFVRSAYTILNAWVRSNNYHLRFFGIQLMCVASTMPKDCLTLGHRRGLLSLIHVFR